MKILSILLFLSNFVNYGQCVNSATITDKNYAQALTQSNTFIIISSSVYSSTIVMLDANPVSGFVLMNPGFVATPSGNNAFIAQTLDGCGIQVLSRINQTHNDNQLNFSPDLIIYPNPVEEFLNVNTIFTVKEYYIYDILGNKIYEVKKQLKEEETIDVSQLPQGVYFFLIKTEEGFKYYKKFIKKSSSM